VGGLCVEGLWLYTQIRSAAEWSWRKPIRQGLPAYVISVAVRVGVGAGVAAAATGSGQVSGTLAAFGLGVAAPLVLEKLAQTVPLTGSLDVAQADLAQPVHAEAPGTDRLAAADPSSMLREEVTGES
jgi:hypothetical protein